SVKELKNPNLQYQIPKINYSSLCTYCYLQIGVSDNNTTLYLECHEKSRRRCPARGVKKIESPFVFLTRNHNHIRNYDIELIYNFKHELYSSVISTTRDLRILRNKY
ncbi:Protein of unknown function, partial [Cotesia congregata]